MTEPVAGHILVNHIHSAFKTSRCEEERKKDTKKCVIFNHFEKRSKFKKISIDIVLTPPPPPPELIFKSRLQSEIRVEIII